jgi:pimeloyl-ACP methyl ester carboxylesterase
VILLPGGVLSADLAYGALIDALGDDVEAVAKDLELYAGDEPPGDYSLDTEVAGVVREADARGWERFHRVGYSGGGAAALATAALHPGRLLSLALLEPAWSGNWDLSEAERAIWRESEKLEALPPDEFMAAFVRLELRPGVAPPAPPPGPPPPWMAKRPAGIRALMRTFQTYDLGRESLRRFDRPVYYALGGLSNPDQYGEIAERLSRVLDDFTLEVFERATLLRSTASNRAGATCPFAAHALGACGSRAAVAHRHDLLGQRRTSSEGRLRTHLRS